VNVFEANPLFKDITAVSFPSVVESDAIVNVTDAVPVIPTSVLETVKLPVSVAGLKSAAATPVIV
jgi:hypothetical protein